MTSSRTRPSSRTRTSPAQDAAAESRRQAKAAALQRQIRLGLLSLAGIAVIGAGLVLYWVRSAANARQAQAALEAAQTALRQQISGLDLHDLAQAEKQRHLLEESRPQWQSWPMSSEFADDLGKAKGAIEELRSEQSLRDAIQQLEQQVAANPTDTAAWSAMRDRAAGLAATSSIGKQLHQRLAACTDSIDSGYYAAVRAKVAAATGDPRQARHLLATAEELAQERIAAAERERDVAEKAKWAHEFQTCVQQEDALETSTFDATAIAKVPWQDLVPGTGTSDWAHSASLGLEHKVTAETLQIDGPEAGSTSGGIVVLHDHGWRDCELEFDADLERGAATIMLRTGKSADPKAAAAVELALAPTPKAIQLQSSQTVHVDILVLGERITVHAGGQDQQLPIPTKVRSGTIGILTEPGTALRLSHMRIRNLD